MSRRTAHTTWRMPLLLAGLTVAGLLAGLLGDDGFDALSWLGLGVPVAVTLWAAFVGRGQGSA